MNAITSIYLPCVSDAFDAEFIANSFDKLGIAQVSRVAIEPFKTVYSRGLEKYNRAYVGIKAWHDTEAAFNFIHRLRNPKIEAKFNYGDDNWWAVEINKFPHKLEASNRSRTLTIFKDPDFTIDLVKTEILKDIVAGFADKKPKFPAPARIYRTNSIDNECNRELKARIYGFKDADEMDAAEAFNGYLHEMNNDRDKWFSEQYIFDSLDM